MEDIEFMIAYLSVASLGIWIGLGFGIGTYIAYKLLGFFKIDSLTLNVWVKGKD